MSKKDGGPAPCAWCDRPSHIRQGRILLCAMHYRFSSMRTRATRDGKYVPTRDEIESLIPSPFVCIGCSREMNWLRSDGASTQVTLQHDRSGKLRLICLGCNTRHAHHPDDSYYDVPDGHKRCGRCDRVLSREHFAVDKSRAVGLKAWCRKCSHDSHTEWRKKNRDHYNAKQREGRARRSAK